MQLLFTQIYLEVRILASKYFLCLLIFTKPYMLISYNMYQRICIQSSVHIKYLQLLSFNAMCFIPSSGYSSPLIRLCGVILTSVTACSFSLNGFIPSLQKSPFHQPQLLSLPSVHFLPYFKLRIIQSSGLKHDVSP